MIYISIFIIIGIIPYIWYAWSFIDYKRGVRNNINWKGPLLLLIGLLVTTFLLAVYYSIEYNLAIFINSPPFVIGLSIAGLLALIISLINIGITFMHRKNPLPKSIHNPKVVWAITAILTLAIVIQLAWLVPMGEKTRYVDNLHRAIAATESSYEEIAVALVFSDTNCLRIRYCDFIYNNVFYVKNNLDETKEVQVLIRALDQDQKELKIVESDILTVEPGEMHIVETEETIDFLDDWGKYTFETDERVHAYQHEVRYRDTGN